MRNGSRRKGAASVRFGQVSRVLRATGLGKRLEILQGRLSREAKERPGRIVAIAVGAGYLLGGGLFSRFTARLMGAGLRVGLRLAVVPVVTQSLIDLGAGMFSGAQGTGGDDDDEPTESRPAAKSDRRQPDSPKKETHS
jgi:hypothetical protein